ncbi:MAG: peptidyl-prolyl cis-trans isomerase [Phycisphaerae bacterium]|nr:peptidyl-prolyl cis-trans isomerase [Phycisphaerae bacterium]
MDARPAALINGRTVLWGDLRPILSDAAGAEALREVVLDQRLAEAAAEAGVTVSQDDVVAERRRLLEALDKDPSKALRLLAELRDRQTLGTRRFERLLSRNALLRRLVQNDVTVTPEAVARLYDATYGPRRQVRLITVGDLATAQAVAADARGGVFFGDLAVERSTDSSAARGGLLEPMTRDDSTYPVALRQAAFGLPEIGAVSDPILLPGGYAVVQLHAVTETEMPPRAEVRAELTRRVRAARERVLMDDLARRLLTTTTVTIFDDALEESWERFKRAARRGEAAALVAP